MPSDEPQAEEVGLLRAELHRDYESVIVVEDLNGARWHYYVNERNVPTLGYPYVTYHGHSAVHLFVPYVRGELPKVLKIVRASDAGS